MLLSSTQRKTIREAITADSVTIKKDGTVVAKRSYFYRHGMDASQFAESVRAQLARAGFDTTIVHEEDKYANWPKTSYFVAMIRVNADVKAEAKVAAIVAKISANNDAQVYGMYGTTFKGPAADAAMASALSIVAERRTEGTTDEMYA